MAYSTGQLTRALQQLPIPSPKILKFLRAHVEMPGRTATAGTLAQAAGYKAFGGVNLHYGNLAKNVGHFLDPPPPPMRDHIKLLVETIEPNTMNNREWLLVMREEFAEALKAANWV